MRVRGDSPGLSSGGSAGDRDEPRVIAGHIYSAGDEKRSVPNAWREIHRRTMRLTIAGGPEAIARGGGISSATSSLPGAPPEDRCLSFPFIVTIVPALSPHVLASRTVPANPR
jgi:hypothetical protein